MAPLVPYHAPPEVELPSALNDEGTSPNSALECSPWLRLQTSAQKSDLEGHNHPEVEGSL